MDSITKEPPWFAVNSYEEMRSEDYIKTSRKVYALTGSYELLDAWWRQNNRSFGMSPWEMWFVDKEKVINYVNQHAGCIS